MIVGLPIVDFQLPIGIYRSAQSAIGNRQLKIGNEKGRWR